MPATFRPIRTILALSLVLTLTSSARAQTWTNFTGTPDSFWTTPGNWTALPAFTPATILNFSGTPPLGSPFQPTGNFTSTANGATTFVVNQMIFSNFGSPEIAAPGVTITTNDAAGTISFQGTNPAISQNGTGAITFANGTAATDLTLTASGLTINGSGTGHLSMLGVIGGTGDLAINQTGVGPSTTGSLVFLSGVNTFVGSTTLTQGNLVIGNAAAFGGAANVVNINGGTIRNTTASAITIANSLNLNSQLFLTGNAAGGFTFTGAITGNGGILMKPTGNAPAFVFQNTISGTGAIVLDSFAGGLAQATLSSQAAAGPHGTALNASSYSLTNSLLTVSNGTANVQRLNPNATMTMNAGLFQITGNAGAATSETLAGTTMSGFNVFLGVSPTTAQPLSLTMGALTRQNNATFSISTTGAGTTLGGTPATNGNANVFFSAAMAGDNINGVLPYGTAVVLNAGVISGGFVRYDAATGVTPLNFNTDYNLQQPYVVGSQPTVNYRLPSTASTFGGTGSISVNSMLLETPSGALFGGSLYGTGTISLTSGTLGTSIAGTQATIPTVVGSVIQQNIALGSATGYFHMTTSGVRNGNVLLGDITGTNGLVKSGPGNVVLRGNNSGLTGGLFVHGGGVIFEADNQLGVAGAGIVLDGGVTGNVNQSLLFLPYNQFGPATVSSLTVSRPITLGPAGGGVGAGGFLNSVSQTPGVTLTLDQTIGGPGRLFKLGTGVLRLTGNNTFLGGISLFQGGTTIVGSDAALGAASGDVFLALQR